MEKDDEVKGGGNSYDFGARMLDARVGRFLSLDRKQFEFSFMSPYCFAANNPLKFIDINGDGPGDRIKEAKKYLGTPYKQQSEKDNNARTGLSESALKYMDCSELVCRVLAADGLTNGIKSMTTSDLISYFDNHSDEWDKSSTPKEGDILLWNGHTGIVERYDSEKKVVYVIHATEYFNSGTKKKVESVVQEKYSMSYYEKKGAFFYRPKNESPDFDENKIYSSKNDLEEVKVVAPAPKLEIKKIEKIILNDIKNEDDKNK